MDNEPFIELTRSSANVNFDETLGHVGICVFEFRRKKETAAATTDFKLRKVIDLTNSRWAAADKFFVVGQTDDDDKVHIRTDEPNRHVRHFGSQQNGDWLMPPDNSYLYIMLTLSAEKDVLNPQLWDFGGGTQNFLRGGLMQYVVENSIDGVILGGKNLPIKCPGRFQTFATNWMWEQANGKMFLPAPKGLAPILSINRCGDRDLLERPSFALNIYNFGVPTPNDVKKL